MFARNAYSKNEHCRYVRCAMESGGDADTLIATTAVDIVNQKPTVVTGEDTGLPVLLIHFVNKKMFFFMSGKNNKGESKVWNICFGCKMMG